MALHEQKVDFPARMEGPNYGTHASKAPMEDNHFSGERIPQSVQFPRPGPASVSFNPLPVAFVFPHQLGGCDLPELRVEVLERNAPRPRCSECPKATVPVGLYVEEQWEPPGFWRAETKGSDSEC